MIENNTDKDLEAFLRKNKPLCPDPPPGELQALREKIESERSFVEAIFDGAFFRPAPVALALTLLVLLSWTGYNKFKQNNPVYLTEKQLIAEIYLDSASSEIDLANDWL